MSASTPPIDKALIREQLHALGFGTDTRDGELIAVIGDLTHWFRVDTPGNRLTVTTAHPRVLRGRAATLAGELLATALNTLPGPGEVTFLPDVGILTVNFGFASCHPVPVEELDEFLLETLSTAVIVVERISTEIDALIERVEGVTGR